MSNIDKNEKYPRKCKICGLGVVEHPFTICKVCGWEDDTIQNDDKNYIGGANKMFLFYYQ